MAAVLEKELGGREVSGGSTFRGSSKQTTDTGHNGPPLKVTNSSPPSGHVSMSQSTLCSQFGRVFALSSLQVMLDMLKGIKMRVSLCARCRWLGVFRVLEA